MDEKLIELENELIVQYPARLQKDKYTKKQFKEYQNAVEFDIKTARGAVVRFAVVLDGKTFEIRCNVSKKASKKIKDIIKVIDYVIENY